VKSWIVFLAALLLPLSASAQEVSAEAQVKKTTQEIVTLIKEDKAVKSGDRKRLLELVDAKVLPHFDFSRMTRLAVGRHWINASPEQRESLVREFRNLLVRTYANAFLTYQKEHAVDPAVEVKQGRSDKADDVTVQTVVRNPGEQPIRVDYDMVKTAQGWKVYDVVVEGVSLVTTYRTTFNDRIQQTGVDGLISLLKEKNQGGQSL
jgi:phospholipid transport system substrate-binding protein